MKITFLRHAETTLNNSGKFCGRTDCDITETGRNDAYKLAKIEPFSYGFSGMYVSPLKRTAQTLNAIYPNCNYIVDERLTEISLGTWEGVEKTSVNQEDRKAFIKGMYNPPNSEETHEEVVNRIMSFVQDIDKTYNDTDSVLVTTHGGVIRTIKQVLNMESDKTKNLDFITIDSKDLIK